MMAWLNLFIAALLEIGWAVGLKYTEGFTRPWPTAWTVGAMILSLVFLGKAARELPIGTAYAVWTGIGAAGTALLGMFLLGEERSLARLLCLAAIVGGVVGLKLVSGSEPAAAR
jgi:quaternary ammonium compound-resistance protein SugE